MENIIKTIMAALITAMSYLFGGADMLLIALVTVIVIDYCTGLAKAYILGQLSSKVGFRGIVKKIMYFAIVAVAVIADNVVSGSIAQAEGVVRTAVIGFLIANEALSILENCNAAGIWVPRILITVLNRLKDQGDKDDIAIKQKE